jgi:hypothetical protein
MQYAFSLGFKVENIILFSWSIGGFATSWLAMHYPDVKGVVSNINFPIFSVILIICIFKILDASFDDIIHLAIPQMPKFACKYRKTILNYSDLIKNSSF